MAGKDKEESEVDEKTKEDKLFARYANAFVKGELPVPQDIVDLLEYHKELQEEEGRIEHRVQSKIKDYDIYAQYLKHIRGIGPMFSANLIAMLSPIDRFKKPSAVTAYAGLTGEYYEVECKKGHKGMYSSVPQKCKVMITNDNGKSMGEKRIPCNADILKITNIKGAMKRKKGYIMMVNSDLKTLMFKIVNSFEKQGPCFYRDLYKQWKNESLGKFDPEEKGYKLHCRLTAMRKTSHRFLVDLHVNWMYGLGYDITPYESTMPNHTIVPMRLDDGVPLPSKNSIHPIGSKDLYQIKLYYNQYYDVQKLRIASFNQIVAWCKANRDRLPKLPKKQKKKD